MPLKFTFSIQSYYCAAAARHSWDRSRVVDPKVPPRVRMGRRDTAGPARYIRVAAVDRVHVHGVGGYRRKGFPTAVIHMQRNVMSELDTVASISARMARTRRETRTVETLVDPLFVPVSKRGIDPKDWYSGAAVKARSEAECIAATPEIIAQLVVQTLRAQDQDVCKAFGVVSTLDTDEVHKVAVDIASRLDDTQRQCAYDVLKGVSGFITGPGGVGKSHLTRCLHQLLVLMGKNVVLTSSTGVAAENLGSGASTIHSFAMLGRGDRSALEQTKISKSRKSKAQWKSVDVLVVDEISMISPKVFSLLDVSARAGRCTSSVFGGVQLVLVGDFYQLPPVPVKGEAVQLCFESTLWKEAVQKTWELKTSHRQSNSDFFELLNRVRTATHTEEDIETLKRMKCRSVPAGVEPTRLYSYRSDVAATNTKFLNDLEGAPKAYLASYDAVACKFNPTTGTWSMKELPDSEVRTVSIGDTSLTVSAPNGGDVDHAFRSLVRSTNVERQIKLKVGAQVMFETNDASLGVKNGTRGVVSAFDNGNPVVTLVNGDSVTVQERPFTLCYLVDGKDRHCVRMMQIPLRLAWSLTVHKSQSQSLEYMEAHLGSVFAPHQVYVALSRACNPDGLTVVDLDPTSIHVLERVHKFYE